MTVETKGKLLVVAAKVEPKAGEMDDFSAGMLEIVSADVMVVE